MFGDSEVYLNFLFKLFYLCFFVLASRSWPSFFFFFCDSNEGLILENLHYYFGLLCCCWGSNWSLLLLLGVMEDVSPGRAHWRSNCRRGDSQASNGMWLLGPHVHCGWVPLDDAACQPQISWRRWYIPGSHGFLLVGLPVHALHQWCQEADFRGIPFLSTEQIRGRRCLFLVVSFLTWKIIFRMEIH